MLAALGQIDPALIKDNQLDIDALKALLGQEHVAGPEHYELSWAGKNNARREIQKSTSNTLRPAADNPERAPHMLIEGENLEVLRVLQKSYYGKVKMIYIDPPYNTGNDSFVYPDDYSETLDEYLRRTGQKNEAGHLNKQSLWKKNSKESGHYHSNWLSMMYPRLYVARNLLREDGVIVMHIDEHELSNICLVLSEIFGGENGLGVMVWDKRNPKGDSSGIAQQHEYVVVFSRNKSHLLSSFVIKREKTHAKMMLDAAATCLKKHGGVNEGSRSCYKKWVSDRRNTLSSGEAAYCHIDDKGVVFREVSMAWPNKNKAPDSYFEPLIHPVTGKSCPVPERGWRNPPKTMKSLLDSGMIVFGKDESTQPTRKYVLVENMSENLPSLLYYGGSDDDLLKDLGVVFDNPKPVKVSKSLISSLCGDEGIVLDFFAGSGTTAQAVMELNLEDGGNRECICVQMPEVLEEKSEAYKAGYRTIADITRARIEKVIAKLKAEHPDKTGDLACAHFMLASSNFQVWNGELKDEEALSRQLSLHQTAEKPDVRVADAETEQAMLAELLLKLGLGALGVDAISKPVQRGGVRIHRVLMPDDRDLWLCFEAYQPALKEAIVKEKPAQVILLDSAFQGDKADEALSNLQLELAGLDIRLTVV